MPSVGNRMAYLASDAGACLGMPWHSEGQGWHTGQHRVKRCICQPYPALHKELNGEGTEGDCKFFAGNIFIAKVNPLLPSGAYMRRSAKIFKLRR